MEKRTLKKKKKKLKVKLLKGGICDLQRGDGGYVLEPSLLIFQVVSLWSLVSFTHLPQFNGLICQKHPNSHTNERLV